MSDGLGYRKDVEFLKNCNPPLVERNADEFHRIQALLKAVAPAAERAEKHTEWRSEGSAHYTARLTEGRRLVDELDEAYGHAAGALRRYAEALTLAKAYYSSGLVNEQALAELIDTKGTAITRTAQEAEPMRQWEDMRDTTGVLDFFAELTMDVDDIRDEANRLHDAAGGDFHLAWTTEKEARALCVHELKQAYDLVPDFQVFLTERVDVAAAMPDLRREAAEASSNPVTRLPGSGPKQDYYPRAGDKPVSPTLQNIRTQLASLPGATDNYWIPPSGDQEKSEWIRANKDVIRAAAQNSGLPPSMVAGIAWKEIAGQPGPLDDITDTIREQADSPLSPVAPENLPSRLGGVPDETSFGPIAIQVRRGAEVLGYDPENLTDQQRATVEESLQDRTEHLHRRRVPGPAQGGERLRRRTPGGDDGGRATGACRAVQRGTVLGERPGATLWPRLRPSSGPGKERDPLMQSSNPSRTGGRQETGHSRHPVDDRPHHPDDDRRLLRVILAVPVVLLTLAAAFFLWLAVSTRPDGDWDQAAYGGIELACALSVVLAGAVGALWLAPSVRRVMRWPWAVPAVVLGVVAVVRWVSSGA